MGCLFTGLSLQGLFNKERKSGENCYYGPGPVKNWIGAPCEQHTEMKDNAKSAMNQSLLLHSRPVDGNVQMRQEFAKNALVVTLKRASRGNAWHARRGNKRMRSWQNMQAHSRHFIVFVRRAKKTQLCIVVAITGKSKIFSAAVWERPRGGGRVCLDCSSKAWSRWSCSLCKVSNQCSLMRRGWPSIVRLMVIKSATTAADACCPEGSSGKRRNG